MGLGAIKSRWQADLQSDQSPFIFGPWQPDNASCNPQPHPLPTNGSKGPPGCYQYAACPSVGGWGTGGPLASFTSQDMWSRQTWSMVGDYPKSGMPSPPLPQETTV